VFQHSRPDQLVKGDAMTARCDKGGARAHGYLEALLLLDSAFLELGARLAQVFDTVDMDRAVTLEVIRQEDVGRAANLPPSTSVK
jgi:hypothetical protein